MFNIFLFTLALYVILTLMVGIIAIIRNPKSKAVHLWFLFSVSVVVWGSSHFMHLIAGTQAQSIFYAKLLYVGASFIPVFFYHFILHFLLIQRRLFNNLFLVIGYTSSIILAYLSITTSLIVSGVSPKFIFPQWLDSGSLHFVLVIHFYLFALVAVWLLLQNINKQDGALRRKTFYIFLAALIGFVAGGSNFFPQTFGWPPYGTFIAWTYILLVAYGVFTDGIKIKFK